MNCLPHFVKGQVIKGFGRGSKDLGCPTANLPVEVVNSVPQELNTGVYYGFAQVEGDIVRKMVMSIGWNPFFKNKQKSMEVHIIHKFEADFYGKEMKIVILGYIRPEKDFSSMDALIAAIQDDIDQAKQKLDEAESIIYKNHEYFDS